ncbi:bile acid:sodium symporter family protein [Streptantibioticus rubrisoli]|uniref:Bile acid:sodium symporter n=1 Tax=Streptantibioticus rubrisoli TaxID=1387313 RepID=A0ABT1PEV3_9ACTN|nr:bile acid:sodium symporter family protein [Streptantibioticus rubrisoli]MCQ4043900.1 bile acid:sodium symporter [Streptantibioticus rubrisoli]
MRRVTMPSWPSWMPIEPFIAALVATVGLAALLPAKGAAAPVADGASSFAVALLFFLYGARLSSREALAGLSHWRLHLTVVLSTFVLFPLLGLAARGLVPYVLTPQLYTGLVYLCVLPSTIQSSIAFTSIARGNVSAAICAGTYSALLGMVVTPVLAGLLLHSSGAGFSAQGPADIALQLLAPFLAGQLLRRWIGGFVIRHKKVLGLVDRGSILCVVYTAFSAGMVHGIWHQVTAARLLALLGVEAVLLGLVLCLTSVAARRLGFPRGDRVAIVFCGSKKSLANGLPMASVLFGAQSGLMILPLMLFHQMQLMVCAVIAKRWSHDSTDADGGREGSLPSERSSPDAQARPVHA